MICPFVDSNAAPTRNLEYLLYANVFAAQIYEALLLNFSTKLNIPSNAAVISLSLSGGDIDQVDTDIVVKREERKRPPSSEVYPVTLESRADLSLSLSV